MKGERGGKEGRKGRGRVEGRVKYVLQDLDALPATTRVSVLVFGPAAGVRNTHRLDRHSVGALAKVRHAAGPLDCAVGLARVAAGPDAQAQVHGRLREILAAVGVLVFQRPHDGAVDVPIQLLRRPVDRVVVEGVLRGLDGVVDGARVARRVALAEVVGLDVAVVAAHELPVDLVQVVGFQHHGRDDALAGRGLHDDLGLAEEEVEVGLHRRRVVALVDGELGPVGAVVDGAGGRVPHLRRHGRRGQVDAVVGDAEGGVDGAGRRVERVAGRPCLGVDEGGEEGEEDWEKGGSGVHDGPVFEEVDVRISIHEMNGIGIN